MKLEVVAGFAQKCGTNRNVEKKFETGLSGQTTNS